jgi:hypothetical protein
MRFPISVLAFSLLLCGCRHTDQAQRWATAPEIRQWIVGTWTRESPKTNGHVTFGADGSFESTSTNTLMAHGTWRIFRPDTSVISLSADGFEPVLYTVRHVSAQRLVLLPPFASVAPPEEFLRFTR